MALAQLICEQIQRQVVAADCDEGAADHGRRQVQIDGDGHAGLETALAARDPHDAVGPHERHEDAGAAGEWGRHHPLANLAHGDAQKFLVPFRADDLAGDGRVDSGPFVGRLAHRARATVGLTSNSQVIAAETG